MSAQRQPLVEHHNIECMIYDNKQQLNNILDQLDKLPPELKDAIFSNANAEKMADIGKQHGLLIDKVGEMTNETGLLMLGVTHPNEFVGNLAERLLVDRQTASKIADDINREIFAPVREHLRAMFGVTPTPNNETRSEAKPPITTTIGGFASERVLQTRATTLEDLEAELERALVEEKGIQPLSMVKKPAPAPKPTAPPEARYKGADPYREQVGEDLPNIQGKAYVPTKQQDQGAISNLASPKNEQVSSFGFQASRIQPMPAPKPVEEHSPFSPLGTQTPPHTNRSALSAFRGFNMNNTAPETKDADKDLL
ncbi:MAG: hypothetical protein A3J55_03460 [Candidatus Ryanbacteria bacterium RIFCSPHIGHO2_02_FULL_45_17b]|nr:MAG: hypothetical protein A3J55_03460 [Candidatus Ryanbacteria bacterium RIFCSPHIGHO2_02_FULL_45_17b]